MKLTFENWHHVNRFITELDNGFTKVSPENGGVKTVTFIDVRHPNSMPPLSSKEKVMYTHLKSNLKAQLST